VGLSWWAGRAAWPTRHRPQAGRHLRSFTIEFSEGKVQRRDTESMKVKATAEKMQKPRNKLQEVLQSELVRVKDLAGLLGLIASLESSHDFIARLATRSVYADVSRHTDAVGWKGRLRLSKQTVEELTFFDEQMEQANGSLIKTQRLDIRVKSIITNPITNTPMMQNHEKCQEVIVSDASEVKAVAYSLTNNNKMELSYKFNDEQQGWSSSARETLAVLKTLQQFQQKGEGQKNINWVTGSEVMGQVLKKGSHRPVLQKLVFDIAKLAHKLQIRLEPIHLKREDPRIQLADEQSKLKDTDNWSIDEGSFQWLNQQFQFTFDLFADRLNRRTFGYFSLYYEEQSQGVDAFSKSWTDLGTLWVCPPVSELLRVHQRIKSSSCRGVLIFPNWQTSSFIHKFADGDGRAKEPYRMIQEWHPYVYQNEGASNTALFGFTNFPFITLAFNH